MGTSHTELSQTKTKMKALLVCSVLVATTSAQYLGYPYALGSPLTYTYTPHVYKPVVKEDEDEAAEAAPAVAAPLLTYAGLPYSYGYPYAGLPYTLGYPYAAAPAVKVAEPTVTEVEIPQIVYKPVEKKVELLPACHNGLGFPVPCA